MVARLFHRLYGWRMAAPSPLFEHEKLIKFDQELIDRLSEFRFAKRFASISGAARALISFALDLIDEGEPAPLPHEDLERVKAYRAKHPLPGRSKPIRNLADREAELRRLMVKE